MREIRHRCGLFRGPLDTQAASADWSTVALTTERDGALPVPAVPAGRLAFTAFLLGSAMERCSLSQLLPCVVTSSIGGQVPTGRVRLHHVERRGDHPPRHVRDGRLIVKWDLDNQKAMKGAATRRILELISGLEAEGIL
jgi:hypothetical protein